MMQRQMKQSGAIVRRFYARLQLLGIQSLAALFSGSFILSFVVSFNAMYEYSQYPLEYGWFRFGQTLSVQTWLAIVGVGFGLVSYGLQEALTHFIDLWCSLQASKTPGLDYTKYLNSQARAPVVLGMRGFPVIVNLQRLMTLTAIGASIGYKFGIGEGSTASVFNASGPIDMSHHPSSFDVGIVFDGSDTVPPWLTDVVDIEDPRSFVHNRNWNISDQEPPTNIVMTGGGKCSNFFPFRAQGVFYYPQYVLIANQTEEATSFTMTKNSTGWFRTETTNLNWITHYTTESVPMIVDYRVLKPDGIQIQWARSGNWYTDSASDDGDSEWEPVLRRLTYKIFPAAWIVPRFYDADGCAYVCTDTIFGHFFDHAISVDFKPLHLGNETFIERRWLDAFINKPETSMREGVAAFVRAAMSGAYVAAEKHTVHPGMDEDVIKNITASGITGIPWAHDSIRNLNTSDIIGLPSLPYFRGDGVKPPTILRRPADIVYLTIGIFGFLIGIVRIWLGPPKLTSWMGQHVYLALGGIITISEKPLGLRSGYEVAGSDLGRLRLPNGETDLIESSSGIEMVNDTSERGTGVDE